MNKQNIFLIGLIAFFVIAFGIGIAIIISNSKTDKQAEIKKQINPLIVSFYEGDYYLSVDVETIKSEAETGITTNIENLELMTNKKVDVNCDKAKSYITIYPKDPYTINDYKVVYNLDCK